MATLGFVGFLILAVCIAIVIGLACLFAWVRDLLWGAPSNESGASDD